MALPAGLSTFTLNGGVYADPTGAVKFVGMVGKLSLTGPLRYSGGEVEGTVTVTVAADGTWTAGPLVNTSDPQVAAQGVAYRMDWQVGRFDDCPGGLRSLTFAVTAGISTVDYDTLVPSVSTPLVAVPQAVGPQGPKGDAGVAPARSTPPSDPTTTPYYIDTSQNPPVLMTYFGGSWLPLGGAAPVNDGVQKLIFGLDSGTGQLYFDPAGPPLADRVAYRVDDAGHLIVYKNTTPVPILTAANLDSYVATITANVQSTDDARYLSQAAGSGRTQGAALGYVQTVERRLSGRVGVAFIGDSLTHFWFPNAEMWHNHLAAQSGGYIRHRGSFSLGGITLETMESTYLPQVLALNPLPGACVVMGGTNNISAAGYSQATTAATLDRICTALEAAGVKPICGIIPPRSDATNYAQRTRLWNSYVRQYAQSRGFAFIDMFAPLVDTATGGYKTGLGASDGIHPTYDGHLAVAAYNLARPNFLASLRLTDGTPRLTGAVGDVANLVGDFGIFLTLTGSGANALYPNGFTGFGNMALIELITDTAAAGNWVRLHRHISDGSANAAINPVTPATVAPGDKVSFAVKYRLNYLVADHTVESGLRLTITILDSANAVLATKIIFGATAGTSSGTAYGELVAPANAAKAKFEARLIGAVNDDASYVDLAQWTEENMTTIGTAGFTTAVEV